MDTARSGIPTPQPDQDFIFQRSQTELDEYVAKGMKDPTYLSIQQFQGFINLFLWNKQVLQYVIPVVYAPKTFWLTKISGRDQGLKWCFIN